MIQTFAEEHEARSPSLSSVNYATPRATPSSLRSLLRSSKRQGSSGSIFVPTKQNIARNDLIVVSEFSEHEGPVMLHVLPDSEALRYDVNSYVVRIMAVDHAQKQAELGSFHRDSIEVLDVTLPDREGIRHSFWAYVHHLTLLDVDARGFVRPICLSFLTTKRNKIMDHFSSLSDQFSAVSDFLKRRNYALFRCEIEQRIAEMRTLRADALEAQSQSEALKVDPAALSSSVNTVEEHLNDLEEIHRRLLSEMEFTEPQYDETKAFEDSPDIANNDGVPPVRSMNPLDVRVALSSSAPEGVHRHLAEIDLYDSIEDVAIGSSNNLLAVAHSRTNSRQNLPSLTAELAESNDSGSRPTSGALSDALSVGAQSRSSGIGAKANSGSVSSGNYNNANNTNSNSNTFSQSLPTVRSHSGFDDRAGSRKSLMSDVEEAQFRTATSGQLPRLQVLLQFSQEHEVVDRRGELQQDSSLLRSGLRSSEVSDERPSLKEPADEPPSVALSHGQPQQPRTTYSATNAFRQIQSPDRFETRLRDWQAICGEHGRTGRNALRRLRRMLQYFGRPSVVISLEKQDLALLAPSSTLLCIGNTIEFNVTLAAERCWSNMNFISYDRHANDARQQSEFPDSSFDTPRSTRPSASHSERRRSPEVAHSAPPFDSIYRTPPKASSMQSTPFFTPMQEHHPSNAPVTPVTEQRRSRVTHSDSDSEYASPASSPAGTPRVSTHRLPKLWPMRARATSVATSVDDEAAAAGVDDEQLKASVVALRTAFSVCKDQSRSSVECFAASLWPSRHVRSVGLDSWLICARFQGFSRHLIYSLLTGRLVLVYASKENRKEVAEFVDALSVFIPGADRRGTISASAHRQPIVKWQEEPVTMADLASLKVVGLSKSVPLSRAVRPYVSVLDFELEAFLGPAYGVSYFNRHQVNDANMHNSALDAEGDCDAGIIDKVTASWKQWPEPECFGAYVHAILGELSTRALLLYHTLVNPSGDSYNNRNASGSVRSMKRGAARSSVLKGLPAAVYTRKDEILARFCMDWSLSPCDISIVLHLVDLICDAQVNDVMNTSSSAAPVIKLDFSITRTFSNQ